MPHLFDQMSLLRDPAIYDALVKNYKRKINESKSRSWHQFVERAGNEDPWGRAYKICRRASNPNGISSIVCDGTESKNWSEAMNALMNKFFSEGPGAEVDQEVTAEVPELDINDIAYAISDLNMGKAPGLDGINPEMAHSPWKISPDCLTAVYRDCFAAGSFPDLFKRGEVITLLKGPDKVRTDPSSYRPITLLPILGKVLEKLMVLRLRAQIEPTMHPSQYGFKNGKSVEDAWFS